MKFDNSKYDSDGQLKNGLFKEHFKDGTLACVGEYVNGEKAGEWKYYLLNGLLKAIGHYANFGRDIIPTELSMMRAHM